MNIGDRVRVINTGLSYTVYDKLFNSLDGTDNSITSSSQVDETVRFAPKNDNKSSRYFCAN